MAGILVLWACAGKPDQSEKKTASKSEQQPKVLAPSDIEATGFAFTDITPATGIAFKHFNGATGERYYVETMAPGCALFDADQDGDLDLYVVDGAPLPGSDPSPRHNRLYLNQGDARFVEASNAGGADDTGYGMAVAVGDYDGDGLEDLFVLNYGENALYRNLGNASFEKVDVGLSGDTWSVGAAFFDYDGDGDLDLYEVNYLTYDLAQNKKCYQNEVFTYCGPQDYPAAADRLWRNDGGRFTDISEEAGLISDVRGMGIAAGDLNGDGRQDLYITNDCQRNLLYLSESGPGFKEKAVESGVGFDLSGRPEGSMGAAIGDFSGKGVPGIFLTNFMLEPNRMYLPIGGGFYNDVSFAAGVGFPSKEMVSWGIGNFDLEGDGDLDLIVANGHVWDNASNISPDLSYGMPDHLYVNDGKGNFSLQAFPGEAYSSRGVAYGDLDGDGDPDLVITACGGPLKVWRNDAAPTGAFTVINIEGPAMNRNAYGAQIRVTGSDGEIYREIADGGSYASRHDARVYLPAGDGSESRVIRVRFPDGSEKQANLPRAGLYRWRYDADTPVKESTL